MTIKGHRYRLGDDDERQLTPYADVNHVLSMLSSGLDAILGDQIRALYLTGSLTYGDFEPESSDIDLLVILTKSLTAAQRISVAALHDRVAQGEPKWAKRVEASYITEEMLVLREPPKDARPYINYGAFWDPDPHYGYEWLMNLYVIRERGIALLGPDPKKLIAPIDIELVRKASLHDLHEDWEKRLPDPKAFEPHGYDPNHVRAYAVLTMCRVLHRAMNDGVASKRVASDWVKRTYPSWSTLVAAAEEWKHGDPFSNDHQVKDFVRFTIDKAGQGSAIIN